MTAINQKDKGYISSREVELIQELVKIRQENDQQLEYEDFMGYEVPDRVQFSMIKKPTVTIQNGKFYCNQAAIRLFEGIKFVLPMVNSNSKRLALVPCKEEESGCVEWAYKRLKDGKWYKKDIKSAPFTENVFKLMKWDKDCRYQMYGQVKNSERGLILVFELEKAITILPQKEEYIDPSTGKKKMRQVIIYPNNEKKNMIGPSYGDYMQSRPTETYESTDSYSESNEFLAPTLVLNEDVPKTQSNTILVEPVKESYIIVDDTEKQGIDTVEMPSKMIILGGVLEDEIIEAENSHSW